MFFDGHADIWTDVTLRTYKGERDIIRNHHLDRLKRGNIEGGIFVMWIDPPYTRDPEARLIQIADAVASELSSIEKDIVIVRRYDDIVRARHENKLYVLIGMEGLSGIGENIDLINHYHRFGARHAGLTWNEENPLATGVAGSKTRGLTSIGKKAVQRILDLGMLLDVSHLNDPSFWDVASIADRPFIASHSNARSLCNAPRNLTDDQIKEIGRFGGLVGINAFNLFVSKEQNEQTIHTLAKHAAYIADLIGSDHVALGLDFCEYLTGESLDSFSTQDTPSIAGLEDASQTPNLIEALASVGFSQEEIAKIAHENYHRLLKQILK